MRKLKSKPKLKSLSYQAFTALNGVRTHMELTVPEISEIMGVSRTTYHRLISNNEAGIYALSYSIDCKVQIAAAVIHAHAYSVDPFRPAGAKLPICLKARSKTIAKLKRGVVKFRANPDTRVDQLKTLNGCTTALRHYFYAWPAVTKSKVSKSS